MAALVAVAAVAGFTAQQPAYAQLVKDHGASGLTPAEDPTAPGWDPSQAEEDAPGQLAGPVDCPACARVRTRTSRAKSRNYRARPKEISRIQ